VALAALTGETWLLAAVLVIDLEILRQLLVPFVRLDGYWLLADLTGVPDLFSQVKPFLRGKLLRARSTGARLPELRPWPRRIFGGYLAATLAVLAFLVYHASTNLPHFVKIAWTSFEVYGGVLREAIERADLLGALVATVQVLILAAPAIGTAALLTLLVSWAASHVWRRLVRPATAWGSGSRQRLGTDSADLSSHPGARAS
jgi:putative peptide zinc metalloprotease protein